MPRRLGRDGEGMRNGGRGKFWYPRKRAAGRRRPTAAAHTRTRPANARPPSTRMRGEGEGSGGGGGFFQRPRQHSASFRTTKYRAARASTRTRRTRFTLLHGIYDTRVQYITVAWLLWTNVYIVQCPCDSVTMSFSFSLSQNEILRQTGN